MNDKIKRQGVKGTYILKFSDYKIFINEVKYDAEPD